MTVRQKIVIVIQCAGRKNPGAGFFQDRQKNCIHFVAHPKKRVEARPDGPSGFRGQTWRQRLEQYNVKYQNTRHNPFGLLPAYQLYAPPIYARLVATYGEENVFILSAGWGLVRADYLLPQYNITFSSNEPHLKRGRAEDECHDFNHLCCADDLKKRMKVVFFGGKTYWRLFHCLTKNLSACIHVFYKGEPPMGYCHWKLHKFSGRGNTNWHYKCAEDFLNGKMC